VTSTDRERWDAKYGGDRGRAARPPDPFVLEALERLANVAPGNALDLACGTGRHALELARRGWRTSAWDVSPVGLGVLAERARSEGLEVETREIDLTRAWPEPVERTDLITLVGFLDRPLLSRVHELLPQGGHLIFTTSTVDRPDPKPPLEFCLERGELRGGLPGLAVLLHFESEGRAGIVAARRS
jgi:tellurite methyltransferase